jgi:hypothetical protein
VPTTQTRNTLREYARLGATRRLEELRQEEARIRAAFPELFRPGRRGAESVAAAAPEAAEDGTPRRRRRRGGMSPAQRKAVSERMKKYWAARRKAKNG